jgi:hypothetical protein
VPQAVTNQTRHAEVDHQLVPVGGIPQGRGMRCSVMSDTAAPRLTGAPRRSPEAPRPIIGEPNTAPRPIWRWRAVKRCCSPVIPGPRSAAHISGGRLARRPRPRQGPVPGQAGQRLHRGQRARTECKGDADSYREEGIVRGTATSNSARPGQPAASCTEGFARPYEPVRRLGGKSRWIVPFVARNAVAVCL